MPDGGGTLGVWVSKARIVATLRTEQDRNDGAPVSEVLSLRTESRHRRQRSAAGDA
jgi:hypothetical protein